MPTPASVPGGRSSTSRRACLDGGAQRAADPGEARLRPLALRDVSRGDRGRRASGRRRHRQRPRRHRPAGRRGRRSRRTGRSVSERCARSVAGDTAIVGLSTHTAGQVEAAVREPVSYVAIGPVFETATKETGYDAVGVARVRDGGARAAPDAAAARGDWRHHPGARTRRHSGRSGGRGGDFRPSRPAIRQRGSRHSSPPSPEWRPMMQSPLLEFESSDFALAPAEVERTDPWARRAGHMIERQGGGGWVSRTPRRTTGTGADDSRRLRPSNVCETGTAASSPTFGATPLSPVRRVATS